jgi:hypothetical protein
VALPPEGLHPDLKGGSGQSHDIEKGSGRYTFRVLPNPAKSIVFSISQIGVTA